MSTPSPYWLLWLDTQEEDQFFVYGEESAAWQGAASLVMLHLDEWIPQNPAESAVAAIRRRLKWLFIAGDYRQCAEEWADWMGQFDFVASIAVLDLPPNLLLGDLDLARAVAEQPEPGEVPS